MMDLLYLLVYITIYQTEMLHHWPCLYYQKKVMPNVSSVVKLLFTFLESPSLQSKARKRKRTLLKLKRTLPKLKSQVKQMESL